MALSSELGAACAVSDLCIFIETNLGTHLALFVDYTDTVADLKKKILEKHPICHPEIGEIKEVCAVKAFREGYNYVLTDEVTVRSVFRVKMNEEWFLSADVATVRKISGKNLHPSTNANGLVVGENQNSKSIKRKRKCRKKKKEQILQASLLDVTPHQEVAAVSKNGVETDKAKPLPEISPSTKKRKTVKKQSIEPNQVVAPDAETVKDVVGSEKPVMAVQGKDSDASLDVLVVPGQGQVRENPEIASKENTSSPVEAAPGKDKEMGNGDDRSVETMEESQKLTSLSALEINQPTNGASNPKVAVQ